MSYCFKMQNCRVNEAELLEEAHLPERVSRVAWRGKFTRENLSVIAWRGRTARWMKQNCLNRQICQRELNTFVCRGRIPGWMKQNCLKRQICQRALCRMAWRGGISEFLEEADLPERISRVVWRGRFAWESKQSSLKRHICQREFKYNCLKRQNYRVNEAELLEQADFPERVSRVASRSTLAREYLSIIVWRGRIAGCMRQNC